MRAVPKVPLFTHEMVNEGTQEVAARTFLTAVCLDTTTRKARPLPADVRERVVITPTERTPAKDSGRLRS